MNEVIFAAAGFGKTYSLCAKAKSLLRSNRNILLISYTVEGVNALKREFKKQNNGVLDPGIVIKSWYQFLLSELIKPYQTLLKFKTGLYTNIQPGFVNSIAFYENNTRCYCNKNNFSYYINKNRDIKKDKVSDLAYHLNDASSGRSICRLESIYSHVFIDEIQDYAGWDLEVIKLLFCSSMDVTCVGDYKQHTYETNNSTKNKKFKGEKIVNFFNSLKNEGVCDVKYWNSTRRFNEEICKFINTIYNDEKSSVFPHQNEDSSPPDVVKGVFILDGKNLDEFCEEYKPVVLRYNKRTPVDLHDGCTVYNYGAVKGGTFDNVVIVPVKTVIPFLKKGCLIESQNTRAKFYVACTRAKNSVVFAVNDFDAKDYSLFEPCSIKICDREIVGYKYIG